MHIIRWKNISSITGLSRSTIARKIKQGTFPKPIKLSESTVGWLSTDIEKWIKDQFRISVENRSLIQ